MDPPPEVGDRPREAGPLLTTTRCCVIVSGLRLERHPQPMRAHHVISILLAAWLALGSTLGSRFLCSCADGTVTVEFGHRFCCDSDDSCCDSYDDGEAADKDRAGAMLCTWSCVAGCESMFLADGAVLISDRTNQEQLRSSPTSPHHVLHCFFQALPDAPHERMKGTARLPTRCATSTSRLRSVLLLL